MNEVKDTGVLLKRTTDEAKISVKMLSISKPMLKATSWLTGCLLSYSSSITQQSAHGKEHHCFKYAFSP